MLFWKVKAPVISTSSYTRMRNSALSIYRERERKSKRKPYIRSAYFKKEKIFLHHFWNHLFEKNPKDRMRRMKFFGCALELLEHSTYPPEINYQTKKETLYRFYGKTSNDLAFVAQVKERNSTGNKFIISVFPWQ